MSEESAILAQFSDWRTVKGRKVLQLIFEVPLEEQAKVLTHLGAPMPLADLWCGIARVARKGKAGETGAAPVVSGSSMAASDETPPAGNSKPKRRWQDMPPSQRAALLTKDGRFWAYLESQGFLGTELAADGFIKSHCGIQSKGELKPGNNVENLRFEDLEGNFKAWSQARGHGVI